MASNVKGKCLAVYFAASGVGKNANTPAEMLPEGWYEVTATAACYFETGDDHGSLTPTAPSGTANTTCSYPLAAGQTARIHISDPYIAALGTGAAGFLIVKGGQ